MSSAEKEYFLRHRLVPLLRQIPTETKPLWGKMTLQQMIQHYADYTRIASAKTVIELVTPEEQIPKYQEFLMSETPFRENTSNPLMPEIPAPVRNKSNEDAIQELQTELNYFFAVFEANEHLITSNPFFGDLNYQMNVQLLHKHAVHHLRQFGVDVMKQEKAEA